MFQYPYRTALQSVANNLRQMNKMKHLVAFFKEKTDTLIIIEAKAAADRNIEIIIT